MDLFRHASNLANDVKMDTSRNLFLTGIDIKTNYDFVRFVYLGLFRLEDTDVFCTKFVMPNN